MRGFSLVELLIVVIIVAVLAAVALPKFSNSNLLAQEAALREDLHLLRVAGDRCEQDTGVVVDIDALAATSPPAYGWIRGPMGTDWTKVAVQASSWKGPYISAVPMNPVIGTNLFVTGGKNPNAAWTNYSRQHVNTSCYYFPSSQISSLGTSYNSW